VVAGADSADDPGDPRFVPLHLEQWPDRQLPAGRPDDDRRRQELAVDQIGQVGRPPQQHVQVVDQQREIV
jgi:hypothetical protein